MTKEQQQEYAREYRRMGFGRLADARYYLKHKEKILRKRKERYNSRRDGDI